MGRLGTPGEELRRVGEEGFVSASEKGTHLVAFTDELLRNVDELLELVRHRGRRYGGRYSGGLGGRGRNTAGYTRTGRRRGILSVTGPELCWLEGTAASANRTLPRSALFDPPVPS